MRFAQGKKEAQRAARPNRSPLLTTAATAPIQSRSARARSGHACPIAHWAEFRAAVRDADAAPTTATTTGGTNATRRSERIGGRGSSASFGTSTMTTTARRSTGTVRSSRVRDGRLHPSTDLSGIIFVAAEAFLVVDGKTTPSTSRQSSSSCRRLGGGHESRCRPRPPSMPYWWGMGGWGGVGGGRSMERRRGGVGGGM